MSNSWDEMKKAKEDSYFAKKDQEALSRLTQKKTESRISPVTGEPMEQLVLHGVVIDRCPKSGGIWLDAGELEQLLEAMRGDQGEVQQGQALLNFIKGLVGSKKA